MKKREVPPALMFGGIAVVAVIILVVAYSMFAKPAPQTDPSKLTSQQLSDPDPPRARGASANGAAGANSTSTSTPQTGP